MLENQTNKKIIICHDLQKKVFESVEEALEFLGCDEITLNNAIENGTTIPVGVRYWYADELAEPAPTQAETSEESA